MQTTLTAKLKLTTTSEQFEALRATQLAYRDALNDVSAYAFAHGKTSSRKQRRANRHASTWAFAQLQGFLAYKATLAGSVCIKVDADYTSQTCPRCGYTSPENRPKKGLLFVCGRFRYALHADLVGARNICVRTRAIRQDWMATGQLSVAPDVTDQEAKAVRLRRYAELRWSPVTSSLP